MNSFTRFKAIFKKDLFIAMSYRGAFVMEFITIIFGLFLVFLIANFIESRTNDASKEINEGYFYFVFWGLVSQDLMVKIVGASTRDLLNYKTSGILEELIQLPSAQITIILGSNLYPTFMSLIRIVLFLLIASFLLGDTFLNFSDVFYFLINLVLLLISFICIGLIAASYSLIFFRAGPIPIFFITFSIIFGSAYYPAEVLPYSLDNLSFLTPLSPALENFRMLSLDDFNVTEFYLNLLKILIFNLIFMAIALLSFKAAFKHAKKNGTFLHY